MKICNTMLEVVVLCCLAERVFSTSVLWPSGRYGLPMPETGCPTANGFHWTSGYLYQDLEDNNSQTNVSSKAHLLGWVSNDVVQYFCIKNQTSSDINRNAWPNGEYCIYRKWSGCPVKMYSGSVLWDDENANGMNNNTHQGSLPAGVYNQDTEIFFCCQISGSYNETIELPVDKPFYLIAYRPYCQEVLNTVHTMEIIVYDTENDNNHNQKTFPYPYGADFANPQIFYCYYQECLWTLTALKGTFTSPYYPQDYNNKASCTWHITVPWNYTISLIFKDFSIQNCCHCDYVEVWETSTNGSVVLIETFCNKTKPDLSKPVNSSSNNVTVVFRSDGTITAKGFEVSYEAIPGAAISPQTTTAISPQTTTKPTTPGVDISSKPTSQGSKTYTRRCSSKPDTEITSKETSTAEARTSTTLTDKESVDEATGNVYVIVGVISSLIVIGGAVAGAVLCFCKKCRIERNHIDRDRLAVTFTTAEKAVINISNVSPDMYRGSEDKDKESYTEVDIHKLEKINILYDSGDSLISSDKDEVKGSDNPLYVSSDDTVKESDNPMYESMDGTLKRTIDAGLDHPVYERMI